MEHLGSSDADASVIINMPETVIKKMGKNYAVLTSNITLIQMFSEQPEKNSKESSFYMGVLSVQVYWSRKC